MLIYTYQLCVVYNCVYVRVAMDNGNDHLSILGPTVASVGQNITFSVTNVNQVSLCAKFAGKFVIFYDVTMALHKKRIYHLCIHMYLPKSLVLLLITFQ